jgi:hypothetical protein
MTRAQKVIGRFTATLLALRLADKHQVSGGAKMLRIRRAFRLGKPLNRSFNLPAQRRVKPLSKQSLRHALHVMGPTLTALLFAGVASGVAHAQGTMDFSGAQTLMTTFKTFAIYAGAIICFGGLIFAGIRMMSGRFQDAIPGLFGALFGAGVLGWGAGWIGSLTGQSM